MIFMHYWENKTGFTSVMVFYKPYNICTVRDGQREREREGERDREREDRYFDVYTLLVK